MFVPNITTNTRGIPYFRTTNVTVGTDSVEFSLGFKRVNPGYFTVSIVNPIPEGTTGTLPIKISVGGQSKPLTNFGGEAVTAADLAGTGALQVLYDPFTGALQLMSPII